jgi:hypothetical protein
VTDRCELDRQKLWYCRWGTMICLVWATSAENAELRVRHQRFDRRLTLAEVTCRPKVIHGDVLVSEATEHDRQVYAEWSEPA